MTKICVFGAGAIGGYIGARLAMKGEAEVSLVARGAHLAAMQRDGLRIMGVDFGGRRGVERVQYLDHHSPRGAEIN